MARLINAAQTDDSVKVIFIHGGLFYSSGNDLSALTSNLGLELDELRAVSSLGAEYKLVQCLLALLRSKKPIVGLVRGQSLGISFTTMSLFDFIYCSPDAKFSTPFMKSF